MSDLTAAADAMAAEEPAPPTPAEAQALAESGKAEGTTPEEVAQVLKGSGIDITPEPPAKVEDVEEGDDPDPVDEPHPAPTDDEPPEETPPPAEPAKPETPPVVTADDDKYSFQIEDLNGVTFKISADAKMEDILAEFQPKNNGQIIDILEQLREVKDAKATDDAKTAQDTADEQRRTRASELLSSWQEEAKVLQGDKRIPEGGDGEKRVNEVYKYMADENTKRMEAGKPTLNSFEDALDKLENKEARDKAVADAKTEKDEARRKGALVGGSSAPASSGEPIYRAGSAKNANQALRSMGMLK